MHRRLSPRWALEKEPRTRLPCASYVHVGASSPVRAAPAAATHPSSPARADAATMTTLPAARCLPAPQTVWPSARSPSSAPLDPAILLPSLRLAPLPSALHAGRLTRQHHRAPRRGRPNGYPRPVAYCVDRHRPSAEPPLP